MKKHSRKSNEAAIYRNAKKSRHGLTPSENKIAEAPVDILLQEFKKVKNQTSKLSSHLRKVVELRVEFLLQEGIIKNAYAEEQNKD